MVLLHDLLQVLRLLTMHLACRELLLFAFHLLAGLQPLGLQLHVLRTQTLQRGVQPLYGCGGHPCPCGQPRQRCERAVSPSALLVKRRVMEQIPGRAHVQAFKAKPVATNRGPADVCMASCRAASIANGTAASSDALLSSSRAGSNCQSCTGRVTRLDKPPHKQTEALRAAWVTGSTLASRQPERRTHWLNAVSYTHLRAHET